jgi:Leucine-rich repeat (LRR) protein
MDIKTFNGVVGGLKDKDNDPLYDNKVAFYMKALHVAPSAFKHMSATQFKTFLTTKGYIKTQENPRPKNINDFYNDIITFKKSVKNLETVTGKTWDELQKVTYLDLSNNKISGEIPEAVGQLTNITQLDLGGNKLEKLPKWIGQLTNITQLDLGVNKLENLPESIGQLQNLSSLSLCCNKLENLPESIGQLTNLTKLYLGSNNLTILPKSIGQLTNLTILYLNSNKLENLPEEIGRLKSLSQLDLRENKNLGLQEDRRSFNMKDTIAKLKPLTTGNGKLRYIYSKGTNLCSGQNLKGEPQDIPSYLKPKLEC